MRVGCKRSRLLVGGLALILTSCAPTSRISSPPWGTKVVEIPGADGSHADLAVDASGGIHVTWSQDQGAKRSTYYQYSSDGTKWTHPIRIAEGTTGRIFAGDSTLHFISLYGIDHYSSHDDGRVWSKRDPLIPLIAGGMTKFDGCSFGDTLLIAYLDNDDENHVVRMNVARFVGDQEIDRASLGQVHYAHFNLHEPRLWKDEHRLWLLANVDTETANVPRLRPAIHLWFSSDHGSHWTAFPVPEIKGGEGQDYTQPTLAWAAPDSCIRLAVVWGGIRIRRQQSTEWNTEEQIEESVYEPPCFGLTSEMTFDSAIRGDLTALAWTDRRYNADLLDWIQFFGHPGQWLNMSGDGFPNNSVLVALDRGAHIPARRIRLTSVPGHALNVRIAFRGKQVIVLWSALVGRAYDQKRPRVYIARVPISEFVRN